MTLFEYLAAGYILMLSFAVLRAIPGTSDALVSEEHGTLNDEAREYAAQYNGLLLGHVRQRGR